MTEYNATRDLSHRMSVRLDGDDRFDHAEEDRRLGKTVTIRVGMVTWRSSNWSRREGGYIDTELTDQSYVTISGFQYKKDGTVGARSGSRSLRFTDLPVEIQSGMMQAFKEVYAP